MFSLLHKAEAAHEDGIWSCTWGSRDVEKITEPKENELSFLDKEPENSNPEQTTTTVNGKTVTTEKEHFVVTGGVDDIVKIWDITPENTLTPRHELKGHSLGIVSVAASNDGKTIASSSLDSTLGLWDSATGEQKHLLSMGPVDLWTVAFSPCDKFVISGSNEGKITMYQVETGKVEQVLDPQNGKFTLSLAYSPDGKYIASGAIDGIITIFDVTAGKVAQTLEGHAMPVRSLCFSPNSQILLTASDDGHMKLYDVSHSDVASTLSGHSSWVLCVSFSQDGKHFASSSSDTKVKIWDLAERKCIHTFAEHNDQVWGVKYSLTNDRVISVSEDNCVNLYNCPPNVVI